MPVVLVAPPTVRLPVPESRFVFTVEAGVAIVNVLLPTSIVPPA